LSKGKITYELIFIDDRSTDNTYTVIKSLISKYPIKLYTKKKQPGKAQSLIEGLESAKYEYLCYIDADLQYPPEAIPEMFARLDAGRDIVVANRAQQQTSFIRQLASRTFMYIFAGLLHGIHCDVQSGLKVFRREVFASITIQPSPWTFDLEFLVRARMLGYRIDTVPIVFFTRNYGKTKIKLLQATKEIGFSALKLKVALMNQSMRSYLQTIRLFRTSK
jgi:glycosyltransferase involved in cell wall biosynthesis